MTEELQVLISIKKELGFIIGFLIGWFALWFFRRIK